MTENKEIKDDKCEAKKKDQDVIMIIMGSFFYFVSLIFVNNILYYTMYVYIYRTLNCWFSDRVEQVEVGRKEGKEDCCKEKIHYIYYSKHKTNQKYFLFLKILLTDLKQTSA